MFKRGKQQGTWRLFAALTALVAVSGCGPESQEEWAALEAQQVGTAEQVGTAQQALSSFDYCPLRMTAYRGRNGFSLWCYCTSASISRDIVGWGTNTYTDDSMTCTMAVHAGAIPASGGLINATVSPGLPSYTGSTRNGITTGYFNAWPGSFSTSNGGPLPAPLCPAGLQSYRGQNGLTVTCSCPGTETQSGYAWGTDVYTDDSRPCRAAVHAGRITTAGGTIRAVITTGRASYTGSTRNGVTTSSYGTYPGSYYFQ